MRGRRALRMEMELDHVLSSHIREGRPLLEAPQPLCPRLRQALQRDGGYVGPLKDWHNGTPRWNLIFVGRPKFKRRLFGREIVEPFVPHDEKKKPSIFFLSDGWSSAPFACRYLRRSKDYEILCPTLERQLQPASSRLITRPLLKTIIETLSLDALGCCLLSTASTWKANKRVSANNID